VVVAVEVVAVNPALAVANRATVNPARVTQANKHPLANLSRQRTHFRTEVLMIRLSIAIRRLNLTGLPKTTEAVASDRLEIRLSNSNTNPAKIRSLRNQRSKRRPFPLPNKNRSSNLRILPARPNHIGWTSADCFAFL
jgi:hypothetical protein